MTGQDISGSFCDQGGDTTLTIYVQPTAKLSVSVADTVVCDSTTINITVDDLNGNVHPATTKVYQLTTTNPGGVIGVQPTGEYPAGTDITDQLINPTNAVQAVTYRFKARIRDDRPGHSGSFCDQGGDTLIVIYVEPTARVTGTISNDTICNINSITYTLSTPNSPLYGIRFNVNVVNPYPEITGYSNRFNLTVSSVITETLTNSGDIARMIMYIITPSTINNLGIQNCPGVNDTLFLWINPTPRATPNNLIPEMCFGQSTRIVLNSPTVMTKGTIKFNYTITVSDTDVVGNMAPANDQLPGKNLIYSYTNIGDTINSVYYHIIPTNILSGCVNGPVNTQEVKVHPHPLQNLVITRPFSCAGGGAGLLTAFLSRGSKPDLLTWDRPSFGNGDTTFYSSGNYDTLRIEYAHIYSVIVTDNFGCQNTSIPQEMSGVKFQTIMAPVDDPITGYSVQCPGDSTGQMLILEDASSFAIPPYEYWLVRNDLDTVSHDTIWYKGPPNYPIINLPAGHYSLYLKDANGCMNTAQYPQAEISEPDPITVTFSTQKYGIYDVSCRGYNDGHVWINTITGGNPGGYKYKWYTFNGLITGPDTLDRIDNVPAGKYYLLTTDLYCTKLDSVNLVQPAGMDLSSSVLHFTSDSLYNISCNGGNDGSIDITIIGGSEPYSYLWTDSVAFSAITQDITGLRAAKYTVKVSDQNGCILKILPGSYLPSFTLNEPPPIIIAPLLSNSTAGPYNINCHGGTGSIDITITGGSGPGTYLYSWTTTNGSGLNATAEDQGALTAGSYHLEVTDLYGCKEIFDTTLTEPAELLATLIPKHVTCVASGMNNGEVDLTVSGGVQPYTYLWSNLATTEDLIGLTAGVYTVTITDANGCQYIDSAQVNLPPPLKFSYELSDHNGYNISCFEASNGRIKITTRSGVAPFVFNWTSPSGFASSLSEITGLPAGPYNMHIADSNSCTVDTTFNLTQPGEFYMNFDPSMSISGSDNINCAGESTGSINVIPVNAVGNVRYLWSDGSTSQYRENLPAGNYEVILTDANFCWAQDTITLTEPDPMKLVFNDTTDVTHPWCPDKPDGKLGVTISGGVPAYTYRWSDGSTGSEITNIPTGWYSVKVTDFNGCSARDSLYLEPENEICLIIPNAISPNGDLINDVWNIGEINLYPDIEIKIFDSWGILVWKSEKGYPQKWDGTSHGRKLPIDSYHYMIDLHNGTKPIIGSITIVR